MHPKWLLPLCLVVVALTRPLFWAPDAIGWDDAVFLIAVDCFDIRASFPHPPGYPYYVLAGQAVAAAVGSGPVALSLIGLVAALAGCFGIYRLALWLHNDGSLAVASTLLWAFIPATWLYHGALFSDGPALGFGLLALGFLATGCQCVSRRDLVLAALLSAFALGIRPQLVVLLFVPWVFATIALLRRRQLSTWLMVVTLLMLGCLPIPIIIVLNMGSLGDAWGLFTSYGEWWQQVDPLPLPRTTGGWLDVLQAWFLDPFGYGWSAIAFLVLGLAGIALGVYTSMRPRILCCLAAGASYAVIALFQLNIVDAARYGLPVQALVALAVPISLVGLGLRARFWACGLGTSVFVASFIVWCSPILWLLGSERPPLTAAIDFLKEHRPPSKKSIVVDWIASAHAYRHLTDVPRFAERKIPFLQQWWQYLQHLSGLSHFFNKERQILRLTLKPRPGHQPLFSKTWSSERLQRLRGAHYHRAAYVYEQPTRVLLAVGWVDIDLQGEEVVDIATPKALLIVAPDVSELSCEVRPMTAGGESGMTLEVCLFKDEDWGTPQTLPEPLVSYALAADAWTTVRCKIESPTTLPARACVFLLRSSDDKELKTTRLHVRRLRTK